jgi:hypothetical protein
MMKAVLPVVLCLFALPAAGQSMEPGEWQFTSVMSSSMMPKPQTAVVTQCISKEEGQDPARFTGGEQSKDCKITPGSKTPTSYNWSVACPQQGLTGEGKLQFSRGAVESEVKMVMDMQGQKMEMVSRTSGRLLGPCKTK